MTKFLTNFMETLEHLELRGSSLQEGVLEVPSELILPKLPKLKTFVNENIHACQLYGENICFKSGNMLFFEQFQ